jgi:hypothetical protein
VVVADAFLGYPEALTKPLILLIEAAKTLSVAVALALLVAGPPELPGSTRRAGADGSAGRDMTEAQIYGLCGAGLIGIGLYGAILGRSALRRLLAFNLIGSGVFLVFGAIARRGGHRRRCDQRPGAAGAGDHRAGGGLCRDGAGGGAVGPYRGRGAGGVRGRKARRG